jgi:hypothetical protein
VYTKINLDPKHVDSTADRGRVLEQPGRKTLEAKDRLDEGRGKTGVGDVVGWKGESQEGGKDCLYYYLFINVKNAYDSVKREVLYNILIEEFHMSTKRVWIINACYRTGWSRGNVLDLYS